MNVRVGNYVTSHANDHNKEIQLNEQLGQLSSALEAAVPDQMFTSKSNPGEAVSAVTAIAKAEQEGQKIYHITPANQATTLPNIHLSQPVMDEIRASLAVGKEVITHTDNVSVANWIGSDYIIVDPNTGIGAYKIAGGMNGSHLDAVNTISTILDLNFSFKSMVAALVGAKSAAEMLGGVANFAGLAGFTLGLIDLSFHCTTEALPIIIFAYTAISLIFMLTTFALAAFTGPVGELLAGIFLGQIQDYLSRSFTSSAVCKR